MSFTSDSFSDFHVHGCEYTEEHITAQYTYHSTRVLEEPCNTENGDGVRPKATLRVTAVAEDFIFKTGRKVPKLGVMLVGWGGNNGSTITAGILANKHKIGWNTKEGSHQADYLGSLTQSSTVRLGLNGNGESIYIPFKKLLPMVEPDDIVIGGWDISSHNIADAMQRAKVLDFDLQRKLVPYMEMLQPLPSIYSSSFIAANQEDRADNLICGTKQEQLETVRGHIREFRTKNDLDKVIVLWTANTERYCAVERGLNDTAASLMDSIQRGEEEVSPSTIFAVASILEGCSYINGSPQNTFVPGVLELAEQNEVFISGDDFKSGQTKMKSVLMDFLVSAGIKPVSIVSYNHLGNNDGKNLSAPEQFRSKEISKSNVVDDMVESNTMMYPKSGNGEQEKPDHCVVIKYVPYVGDSKRAMDEYTSQIFMGGTNTIVMHNTCEDSLLASPIILDLVILCELCERIAVKRPGQSDEHLERFHSVLSILSYLMKAPIVPPSTPVVNALSAQRQCIINVFRACVGLQPENYMMLEHRLPSLLCSVRDL